VGGQALQVREFSRAARFVNSLVNGEILSRTESSSGGFNYVTYEVRLSAESETGMYDLTDPATTRSNSTGFVVPSLDEWVKAASTTRTVAGRTRTGIPDGPADAQNASPRPGNGDAVNAADQPVSSYKPTSPNAPAGTYPTWCPPQAGADACSTVNPFQLLPGIALLPRDLPGELEHGWADT
jgi:hypothetical protein